MSDARFASEDEEVLHRLKERGWKPSVVYDVGASNGSWSAMAGSVFGPLLLELFEPLINIAPSYRKDLEFLNPQLLTDPNVRLHPFALGREPGSFNMTIYEDAVSSTLLDPGKQLDGTRQLEMRVETVDSCVGQLGFPTPDLIKMDTQGNELAVLEGAKYSLPHCSALVLECWLTKSYGGHTPLFSDLVQFLKPFGFEPFDFAGTFRESGNLINVDAWFLNTNMPLSPLNWVKKRGLL